jgi:SAM-dependent methyltransferase
MPTKEEVATAERFGARYSLEAPAGIDLERFVLGSDYGATGFTTVAQADLLADVLALRPTDRLLDIGSGCGWPGLYLGARRGCTVVVTDLSAAGILRAHQRIRRDGLASSFAVVASARHLPFAEPSFDGIVHADSLC